MTWENISFPSRSLQVFNEVANIDNLSGMAKLFASHDVELVFEEI
jgi:hypothetical protein